MQYLGTTVRNKLNPVVLLLQSGSVRTDKGYLSMDNRVHYLGMTVRNKLGIKLYRHTLNFEHEHLLYSRNSLKH